MAAIVTSLDASGCAGLRMSADEYLQLPPDGSRYELVNGMVLMSPSPSPAHQGVALEVAYQIKAFLRQNDVGRVFHEVDVRFDDQTVYRPDLVFVPTADLPAARDGIRRTPAVVIEVVSPAYRLYDLRTKKDDYERFGVGEYWIVDPEAGSFTFYRRERGRFIETAPTGERFASASLLGFELDLGAVRRAFEVG